MRRFLFATCTALTALGCSQGGSEGLVAATFTTKATFDVAVPGPDLCDTRVDLVDISADAAYRKVRAYVEKVEILNVTAEVVSVDASNQATRASAEIFVEGNTLAAVALGSFKDVPLTAGSKVAVTPDPSGIGALQTLVRAYGKFHLRARACLDAVPAAGKLSVTLTFRVTPRSTTREELVTNGPDDYEGETKGGGMPWPGGGDPPSGGDEENFTEVKGECPEGACGLSVQLPRASARYARDQLSSCPGVADGVRGEPANATAFVACAFHTRGTETLLDPEQLMDEKGDGSGFETTIRACIQPGPVHSFFRCYFPCEAASSQLSFDVVDGNEEMADAGDALVNESVHRCGAPPAKVRLTVTPAGDGSGRVTSAPTGIDCGSTCAADFDSGTQVTLTATAGATSTFGGWSGGCRGTGACTVSLASATTVTATFAAACVPACAGKACGQPDGCGATCTSGCCGDRRQDAGEACDDGNTEDTDACRNDCTTPTYVPSFTATSQTLAVSGETNRLRLADLDGDGKLDIATAVGGSGNAALFFGEGEGRFTSGTELDANSQPTGLAIADVDKNGKLDLLVGNYVNDDAGGSGVTVLLNSGNRQFGSPTQYPAVSTKSTNGVAVADLNGDGFPDVVNTADGLGLNVFLHKGAGASPASLFNAAVPYGTGSRPWSLALADYDGDQDVDVAMVNLGDSTVALYENNGGGALDDDGGSGRVVGTDLSTVIDIASADFNGDGRPDLVTANMGGDSFGVGINLGRQSDGKVAFSFSIVAVESAHASPSPGAVATADFNDDGQVDIAIANRGSGEVSVHLNDGLGGFGGPPITQDMGGAPFGIAAGDVDGNGTVDLVVANGTETNLTVLLNTLRLVNP